MRRERTVLLVLFASALGWAWRSAPTTALERGPYLQRTTTTTTTLVFRTEDPARSVLRYGTRSGSPDFELTGASGTTHVFDLAGLRPGSKYYYEIEADGSLLAGGEDFFFRTAPPPNSREPFRFVAWGDSGTGGSGQMRVADQIAALEPPGDLALGLGDLVYPDGDWDDYDPKLFEPYAAFLPHTPFWPTLGNHDTGTQNGAPYFDAFYLPTDTGAPGFPSNTENYYSFDHGMAHFVCVDTESSDVRVGSTMYNWVAADIDDANARGKRWTFVFMHHPPHSAGTHESEEESELTRIRENLIPMLEAKGVDMVLAGHSHVYERSYLSKDEAVLQNDPARYSKIGSPDGTIFLVSGCGGRRGTGPLDHPLMAFDDDDVYGFSVLDVSYESLRGYFVYDDGTVADLFEVKKDVDTRSPLILDATVTQTAPGRVVVVFDEPLQPGAGAEGAENPESYEIQGPVSTPGDGPAGRKVVQQGRPAVLGATLLGDRRTVVLDTTTLASGTAYFLHVTNVQDVDGNATEQSVWFVDDRATSPVARIDADVRAANVPAQVSFSGERSFDPDGVVVSFLWDPGDGSPFTRGQTLRHGYTEEGTFRATLLVTDDQGNTSLGRREIRVLSEGAAPTVVLDASVLAIQAGGTVAFDASGSSDPDGGAIFAHWNFGDPRSGESNQSTAVKPSHTYAVDGHYAVTLTVTDDEGSTAAGTRLIVVGGIQARNGSGVNPHTLVALNAPKRGRVWRLELDCSAHGPGSAFLAGHRAASSGPVIAYGEVLVDLTSPRYFASSSPHASGTVGFSVAIPDDPGVYGLSCSFQGICYGTPGPQLSNAVDASIGERAGPRWGR